MIKKDRLIKAKSDKGAITLYVLLVCLFFTFTLTGVYISNVNRLKTQEQDIKQIQENYARELDRIDEIYDEMKSTLKVGDYVDYVPDENTEGYSIDKLSEAITGSSSNTSTITQDQQYAKDGTGMTWQILRIYEDGSIDLIGSTTSQSVCFSGVNGYNNGVTVMNDICKTLYSRGNIEARSVNYKDLEYWLTDEGREVRDNYSYYDGGPIYGHTQTYMSNYRYYPNLYAQEIGAGIDSGLTGLTEGIDKEQGNLTGLGVSDEGIASGYTLANKSLTATQTYWGGKMNETNFGEGYNALKTINTYWVASRYVYCDSVGACFGIRYVNSLEIYGAGMFDTNYITSIFSGYFRPVVSLPSSVQIEACTGANDIDNMHKITQY